MIPTPPTDRLLEKYGSMRVVTFKSPDGVPEEECGTLQALIGSIEGGPFDGGPLIRTFWKPSAEEIEALRDGAVIELDFFDSQMSMTALNVETDV